MITSMGYAQGIIDSVFQIKGVEITADQVFVKEEAGMKQTEVDTVILQEKAIFSLSDVLSENTSVFIKNHGRGALATASFRGTSASHTQVSWNGIRINSPMAGMVDFSLIPVYLIDNLNLKHGSASMSEQGGGLGGSVSIQNSVKWDGSTRIKYLQGIGSYRTYDEFLQLGVGIKKVQLKSRLYHNFSKNDYTFINRGIGSLDPESGRVIHPLDTNDQADYKRFGMLQEIYFRPHSDHLLSLKYWGQSADRTIPRPTSYEGPDNSNLNSQHDLDHRVVTDWHYYRQGGKLLVRSGYSGKQLVYSQKNQVPGLGMISTIFSESRIHSLFNTLSYAMDVSPDFSAEGAAHLNYHKVSSRDTVSKNGYDQQRAEFSLFMAFRRSFADRFNLNLMLRQEWFDRDRAPFSPYLGFDIKLLDGAELVLKGNLARNYHQPALNDLYWQPGGNPDLLPEVGLTAEAGLEYQHIFSGNRLKSELTLFRSDIDNWIIWIPSYKGYWEPTNISKVLSKGMEYSVQLQGEFHKLHYRLAGTYAYTRSVNYGDSQVWGDESYGKQLVYIPLHSGNFMVHISYSKFFITYQHNSYSERYTTSSNDLTRRDWLYPYFMNNLVAGRQFRIKNADFTAELKVFNLFNETYHTILYRPMPGRNYNLVIMMKL